METRARISLGGFLVGEGRRGFAIWCFHFRLSARTCTGSLKRVSNVRPTLGSMSLVLQTHGAPQPARMQAHIHTSTHPHPHICTQRGVARLLRAHAHGLPASDVQALAAGCCGPDRGRDQSLRETQQGIHDVARLPMATVSGGVWVGVCRRPRLCVKPACMVK